MDIETEEFDIIIVGAGVSGLSAAFHLCSKDKDLRILVLEAKDRVGGRTCVGQLHGANGVDSWDLGGQWIGNCQPHVMALIKELGLQTYSQFTEGKKVLQLNDNKISHYTGSIPAIPWYALIDLHLFITKVDNIIKDINLDDPCRFADAELWDSKTFEDLKKSMLWTNAAKQLVDISGRCVFGTEASQISALYYLIYCAAAGGITPLISSEPQIGGQELKIKGGAWKICQSLCEKIGKEKVVLEQAVIQIQQGDDGVLIKTVGGLAYRCQRAILALPPHQQAMIEYIPSLPAEKLNVIHRMPVGNITKVLVTYKTAFWRTAGLSGEAVTWGGSSIINGIDHGPLCIVFDCTTTEGSPALVGFIGGKQQIQYSSIKTEDRKKAVLHSLSEMFGKQALDPIDYIEKNWNDEPYNHGGPVSVATPGIVTSIVPGLQKAFGRLHFAGTESATVWCGFINGAVQSGIRAANEVLYNLRPQVVTAADLEDIHCVKRTGDKKSRRGLSRFQWFVLLTFAGGALYLIRNRSFKLPLFNMLH